MFFHKFEIIKKIKKMGWVGLYELKFLNSQLNPHLIGQRFFNPTQHINPTQPYFVGCIGLKPMDL